MQPSYGHITSAIKPNCSFTIIYDFRLNQSYQYAGRQPAFLLRGPPGTAGTPGSQEEMAEMEGMGHRELEVIYVVEAAFPMFLILKVPIYLVLNTIRQL